MPDLPPVEQAWDANVGPYVAALDAAIAMADALAKADADAAKSVLALQATIDSLHGKTVDIGVAVANNAAAAAAAVNGLAQAETKLSAADQLQADQSQLLAQVDADVARAQGSMAETAARVSMAYEDQARLAASLAGDTGGVADAADRAGACAIAADAAARTAAGGWRIFGVAAGTVLHWVVAAGAEFLAVAIPASVALGSAMLVAAQGAQMVQQHMSALYDATEATANMFHVTIGSALGLRSALQQAQDQANPIVWSVLGGVINIVKSNFQDLAAQGLDVMRVFQTFTARVVADFQSGFGQQVHGLLAGMVVDLTSFGQILGNVGHALLNFAAAMPGLAAVLLGLVTGASHVLLWFSQLPPILITVAMAMEEVWRWGGPLAAILTRIPALFAGLLASGLGIVPVFGRIAEIFRAFLGIVPGLATAIGVVMTKMTLMPAAFQEAGASLALFGTEAQAAVTGLSTLELGLGAVAAGALTFLIIKAATARTGIQQLAAAMQQTVGKASGAQVFGDIAGNLAKLSAMQEQATQTAIKETGAVNGQTVAFGKASVVMSNAAGSIAAFNGPLQQQQQDLINTAQSVTFLSHAYRVSFVGALELGTQAGVQWDQGIGRMSVAADINRLKVLDLMAGYKAMGQSAGAVGMDMTAIAIQSGLQASKIAQLTQAWQSYMGLLTGGTGGLATFEQGLANIGTVAASTAGRLFESQGKMSASTQAFSRSLQSFTGKGAQNWQNFNQVVTTGAEGFINWMQTAGAAGVVHGGQMANAIKGVVAQLIPFASHSQAARAELAGLAAQTGDVVAPTTRALQAWAKGGDSARALGQFVQETTAKLSDMGKVAQNLGNVMQNDLVAMFDKAKIAASGLPGALATLSGAMHTSGTSASVMQGDILSVVQRLLALHTSLPTVSALLNSMGVNISVAGVKALIASGQLQTAGNSASTASGKMHGAAAAASALEAALASLHSINLTVTTSYITEGAPGLGGQGFVKHAAFASGGIVPGLDLGRDSQLVAMRGGEGVLTPSALRTLGAENLASLNAGGGSSATGGRGGGSDSQVIHVDATIPVTVTLDGKEIFKAVQRQQWQWSRRNTGGPGSLTPG